jgi:hypothetical protein
VVSWHDNALAKALQHIIAIYERRGFSFKQKGADEEFDKVEDMMNVEFDFASKDDHGPTIKRIVSRIIF